MNEGLEALKSFKSFTHDDDYIIENKTWKKVLIDNELKEKYDIIEKDLEDYEYLEQSNEELQKLNTNYGKRIYKLEEVLDIIIKKQVHIARVNKCDNILQYNMGTTYEERYLTETEFNKIKELLENE